ncbi:hypothetical protein PLESTF_000331700 [Pleodorina starrii]|nr:hypothetical protein PLESTF_000331700 [Pleodorina starrii]
MEVGGAAVVAGAAGAAGAGEEGEELGGEAAVVRMGVVAAVVVEAGVVSGEGGVVVVRTEVGVAEVGVVGGWVGRGVGLLAETRKATMERAWSRGKMVGAVVMEAAAVEVETEALRGSTELIEIEEKEAAVAAAAVQAGMGLEAMMAKEGEEDGEAGAVLGVAILSMGQMWAAAVHGCPIQPGPSKVLRALTGTLSLHLVLVDKGLQAAPRFQLKTHGPQMTSRQMTAAGLL